MAVDYGMSIGFAYKDLILALLITQFVGFPSAFVYGKLGERTGLKNAIYGGLAVYLLVVVWAIRMTGAFEFYLLAVMIGLVQGGVQALSRSYYARLIPQEKAGEFFGFYNMIGKFAVVIGPALIGVVGRVTHNSRMGIAAVALLFIAGGVLLYFVKEEGCEKRAA
jgi:UMF1 family MFS transporter